MEAIPRNDGEQYRFDAFCKAVLRNEARNYHRNKKRLLDREKSFSVLSLEELGQLTSVDHYPSEEFVFSSYGCDLHIDNELVANAFAALPKQEQSILCFAFWNWAMARLATSWECPGVLYSATGQKR